MLLDHTASFPLLYNLSPRGKVTKSGHHLITMKQNCCPYALEITQQPLSFLFLSQDILERNHYLGWKITKSTCSPHTSLFPHVLSPLAVYLLFGIVTARQRESNSPTSLRMGNNPNKPKPRKRKQQKDPLRHADISNHEEVTRVLTIIGIIITSKQWIPQCCILLTQSGLQTDTFFKLFLLEKKSFFCD